MEKRCQGKGMEKGPRVRMETVVLMGRSKEVSTKQAGKGIKGSNQVKTLRGMFPGRGKDSLKNSEADSA